MNRASTFLTAASVTTDASGNGSFSLSEPTGIYTATATDPGNNTSAFSNAVGAAASTVRPGGAVTRRFRPGQPGEQPGIHVHGPEPRHGHGDRGDAHPHAAEHRELRLGHGQPGDSDRERGDAHGANRNLMGGSGATVGVVVQPQEIGSIDVTANVIADQGLLDPSQGTTTIPISVSPSPPTNLVVNRSTGAGGSPRCRSSGATRTLPAVR